MTLAFSQRDAARLAGLDDRNFRVLVDARVILPTPETRRFGRGRAKEFAHNEVVIANILARCWRLNMSKLDLAQIGDWLRSVSGGREFASAGLGENVYVTLALDTDKGCWNGNVVCNSLNDKSATNFVNIPIDSEGAPPPITLVIPVPMIIHEEEICSETS